MNLVHTPTVDHADLLDELDDIRMLVEIAVDRDEAIDMIERAILAATTMPAPGALPAVCPLQHVFTPGLYTRQITMPPGALIVSKIHKTRHPFLVSKGRVMVLVGDDWQEIVAPYMGVTEPGTRRVLCVLEETVWTTFHVNPDDGTDLSAIEARIIEPRLLHKTDELAHVMTRRIERKSNQVEQEESP